MSITIGYFCGMTASILFTLQYFPQAILTYKRKTIEGFSAGGIIIKLIGASYLCMNAWILKESFPVVAYGLFNIFQHSIFMIQFYLYATKENEQYLIWLLFPLIPLSTGILIPQTLVFTNFIKPLCQIFSHIPQIKECIRVRTTSGLSLLTQHMNFIGGILGLIMCYEKPPVNYTTYLLYINSMMQALTTYMLYFYYDYDKKKLPL